MIEGDVAGPLAGMIAVLREPRLHLLDRHPINLRDPAGDVTATVTVNLPLESDLQIEDLGIHAVARLTQVHLSGLVAGRDIDQGAFDMDVTVEGLSIKGNAQVAGIAAQIDAAMDFRPGPPSQVQQRVTATARPRAGQLAAAGSSIRSTCCSASFPPRSSGPTAVTVKGTSPWRLIWARRCWRRRRLAGGSPLERRREVRPGSCCRAAGSCGSTASPSTATTSLCAARPTGATPASPRSTSTAHGLAGPTSRGSSACRRATRSR